MIGVLFCQGGLRGQDLHTNSNRALKYYNEGKQSYDYLFYDQAKKAFNRALEIDPAFYEAHMMLAELHRDMNEFEEAKEHYRLAVAIDSFYYTPAFFYLAEMEMYTGDYKYALENYRRYMASGPSSDANKRTAKQAIKNCRFALEALLDPLPFKPVNLGENINSEYNEYWPSVTADGQTLVFTVLAPVGGRGARPGAMLQEDFYISRKEQGRWNPAESTGRPLNTPGNEGAQSLSADGRYMFFTACDRTGGMGSCDIYISRRVDDTWTAGTNIGSPVNTSAWETQPSLSADGKQLYFASNRPGGKGGMDLWTSHRKEDGTWGNPVNLGDSINTPFDEMSPFIHPDNKTLYFSSRGKPGMGGFDLFYARKESDTMWTQVHNLGYPINTYADEIGLVLEASGINAYYSSSVDNQRKKDIFTFEMPERNRPEMVTYMKGKVYDRKTGMLLEARFELTDLGTGKKVMESQSGRDGSFLVCIPTNRNYALNVQKQHYLFFSDNIPLKGVHSVDDPFLKDIPLRPAEAGEVLVLNNVFFDYNSARLLPESLFELDRLYDLLQQNPGLKIEIGGHTDSSGKEAYNDTLSERRARSVYDYLAERGLPESRAVYRGYGEQQPVSDNDTPAGRQKNRRTEITILGSEKEE